MLKKIALLTLFTIGTIYSQTIVNLSIGPSWPSELKKTDKKLVWNGSIEYGKIFDNIIGVGADLDFSWRINDDYDTTQSIIGTDTIDVYERVADDKIFMFPISVALFVDPIPKYKFHPVARAQFGLNMMVRSSEKVDESTGDKVEDERQDGFYIGMIGKGGIDGVFDVGEHAAIFAGFEYQWGKLRHRILKGPLKDNYTYFKFNAPMIRMGLSVLF